jgi:hypothetical protein
MLANLTRQPKKRNHTVFVGPHSDETKPSGTEGSEQSGAPKMAKDYRRLQGIKDMVAVGGTLPEQKALVVVVSQAPATPSDQLLVPRRVTVQPDLSNKRQVLETETVGRFMEVQQGNMSLPIIMERKAWPWLIPASMRYCIVSNTSTLEQTTPKSLALLIPSISVLQSLANERASWQIFHKAIWTFGKMASKNSAFLKRW